MNTDLVRLRKYEHLLVISGAGVIAFGIWSILKALIFIILSPVSAFSVLYSEEEMAQMQGSGITERGADMILIAGIIIALVVDLLLRIYIGRSAILDGRNHDRKRSAYVVLAILVALGTITSMCSNAYQAVNAAMMPDEQAQMAISISDRLSVSWIVDLTSFLALLEMILAAIKARKLREALTQGT